MPDTAIQQGRLRNVAIIAHVDHGKTTLVDQMLKQSGQFRDAELDKLAGGQHNLIMDTGDIERERGITILSKNCAVTYAAPDGEAYRINIVDTPGHADFGGEVERVLRMADGCLLVVDAFDGPMPQTRFVLGKALEAALRPVLVVNKCDRPDARPEWVVDQVFDLLAELGADDAALDFRTVFASARDGWATAEPSSGVQCGDLREVFDAIVDRVPAAHGDPSAPLQVLVTTLDASDYVGRIGIGRVCNGVVRKGASVAVCKRDGKVVRGKVAGLQRFEGLGRVDADAVSAGDLCALIGVEEIDIGDTIADPESPVALPSVAVDEPTLGMVFRVNDSPMAGTEGEFVTSRQLRSRLEKELLRNVALRVDARGGSDEFEVSGRGMLHLGVLLETMRREGYELAVGKPRVVTREIDGVVCEPIEAVTVDTPAAAVGAVMELVGSRNGQLHHMEPMGAVTRLEFEVAARGLIGLRSRLLTVSGGEAQLHHIFDRFEPFSGAVAHRAQGVLVASETGTVTAHAVELAADRGVLFVEPGDKVYAGQVVGEHNRENDIVVNIVREKKLTNIRSSTKEAFVTLKASRQLSLEQALEYIEDDELVEITPAGVRLRKKLLDEGARRRAGRAAKSAANA